MQVDSTYNSFADVWWEYGCNIVVCTYIIYEYMYIQILQGKTAKKSYTTNQNVTPYLESNRLSVWGQQRTLHR